MCPNVGGKALARRQILTESILNGYAHPAEHLIQDSLVQPLFVLEVVIEQRLVYTGGPCDCVGECTGYSLAREFGDRRLEDRGAALLRLSAGSKAGFSEATHVSFSI